jgi:hypothetical protein
VSTGLALVIDVGPDARVVRRGDGSRFGREGPRETIVVAPFRFAILILSCARRAIDRRG